MGDGAGVALAALYCLPDLDARFAGRRVWLVVCAALWLMFVPIHALGMLHGL